MVNSKPAERDNQPVTIVRSTLNYQQIFWLVLVSMLIHGLGLLLFARYQRFESVTPAKTDLEPIEFTVVPEDPKAKVAEDEISNSLPPNSKPEATPPTPAIPPSSIPKPIEPTEKDSSTVLSGSDKASTPATSIPKPKPLATPPKNDSVATSLPPQTQPLSQPEVQSGKPKPESGVSNNASDLLGGDFDQTLASGGDAFFSPEALEYKSVLNPKQLKALKDIDLSKYLAAMEGRVKPNWNPSFRQDDRTTVLNFKIEKNGQVTGLKVTESSGLTEVDQEALAAVQNSAPFASLPANFPLENLEITFSFNIHIY
jgi:periplasmic protein TonB